MWYVKSKIRQLVIAGVGAGIILTPATAWAATGTIQSQICDPFADTTITAPADGTQTNDAAIHVTGTAEPAITVTILRGGVGVGATTTAGDGTYGIEVPLVGGNNSLVARGVNSCGTAHDSGAVNIVRIVPDEPEPEPTPGTETPPITGLPEKPPVAPTPGETPQDQPGPGLATPVITKPKSGSIVSSPRLWVSGSASPGSIVSIVLNGVVVAQVTASSEGSYAALVNLTEGSNTIQVIAVRDGQSAASEDITVTYTPSEEPTKPPKPEDTTLPAIIIATGGILLAGISLYGAIAGYHWIRPRLFKGPK